MRGKTRFSLLAVAALSLSGCIDPCGDFSFTGTEVDTSSQNGVNASVSFDFDPLVCASTCNCDLIPYVQIVRTWSFDTHQPLYPTTEKQQRATANGWYIDRIAGRNWGYYGRNDDGSFASYLTPGSNSTDAVLGDGPRRPESAPWLDIWWEAVSGAVCIDDAASCANDFCGYYFWSWIVDAEGTVTGIPHANAGNAMDDEMDDAVAEWNTQAATLGKNAFPSFGRLTD